MVEIADCALSPGINEPFTAIRCIDQLSAALCHLVQKEIPFAYRYNDQGQLRVFAAPVVIALALLLIVSLVFVVKEDKLPTLFDFLFVLAALLNAGGWVWGWFYAPGRYDELVHGFTMFAITLALSFLVYSPMLPIFRQHKILYLLTIASFGIAIGALWKIAE